MSLRQENALKLFEHLELNPVEWLKQPSVSLNPELGISEGEIVLAVSRSELGIGVFDGYRKVRSRAYWSITDGRRSLRHTAPSWAMSLKRWRALGSKDSGIPSFVVEAPFAVLLVGSEELKSAAPLRGLLTGVGHRWMAASLESQLGKPSSAVEAKSSYHWLIRNQPSSPTDQQELEG